MEFEAQQAIYLQIAEHVYENVLQKKWHPNDRIISVREMATQLEVNPNTVMRSYAHLESQGIIYKQRGIGYFIDPSAYDKTLTLKKDLFFQKELPTFLKKLNLLQLSLSDITGENHENK